jgi:nickel-type superoxide dismutase maturation protease
VGRARQFCQRLGGAVVSTVVRRVAVEGASMIPTVAPGERVTVVRRWRRVRAGDVVVVRDPRSPSRLLLKRCVRTVGAMVDLRGDNEAVSTDSRDFGLVPARDVRWLALVPRRSP